MNQNKRFDVTDNTNNPYLCDWNVTDYANGAIVHMPMNSEYMAHRICNLLNEMIDKNNNLRESRRELINANNQYREKLTELTDEKEQLKSENSNLRFEMGMYEQKIADVEKENKELIGIKNKYKGQVGFLLYCIKGISSKEYFEEIKGYLQKVDDTYD